MRQPPSSRRRPRVCFTPENIHALRLGLHLTQTEFGGLLGVTKRTIIRWEQGQHLPNRQQDDPQRRRFVRLYRRYEEWLNYERDNAGNAEDHQG